MRLLLLLLCALVAVVMGLGGAAAAPGQGAAGAQLDLMRQEEATRGVEDVARVARRAGALVATSQSYTMSGKGANTAGNDEEE